MAFLAGVGSGFGIKNGFTWRFGMSFLDHSTYYMSVYWPIKNKIVLEPFFYGQLMFPSSVIQSIFLNTSSLLVFPIDLHLNRGNKKHYPPTTSILAVSFSNSGHDQKITPVEGDFMAAFTQCLKSFTVNRVSI